MYYKGDTPGKGLYVCAVCGQKVTLEKDDEKLPICPKCKGAMYR